jgi:hypothetical protein
MPRSNASFLGQLLGTSQKITTSALDDSVSASLGGGVTAYATAAVLPLSGNAVGDQAFVNETGRLYIFTGTGWYNIALINTNPTITSGANASYDLSTDGTPTVLTLVANDPEGVPITWSYSVTTGSLSNGGGVSATVTQADNVFTITPSTNEAYVGDFGITFTASDGVNLATSASTFSLAWAPPTVEYLIVAGGGSGGGMTTGGSYHGAGGGGGAGGYRAFTTVVAFGNTYDIIIGAGGAGLNSSVGNAGTNTKIFGFPAHTVFGGGNGGRGNNGQNAGSGGSGGGGTREAIEGGDGMPGNGYSGGTNGPGGGNGSGGGGAGGVGGNGINVPGPGGVGLDWQSLGTFYAGGGGGGGGGNVITTPGAGGNGGGGTGGANSTNGNNGGNASANTGGGGGGGSSTQNSSSSTAGGNGGSGVAILRYADTFPPAASTTGSPTITVAGGYRVYKFTHSGSITF